jgi:hypothetical protein
MNIGSTPFTCQALKHNTMCHILCNGGASDEMRLKMEETEEKYSRLKSAAGEHGVNVFVFDSKLPVYKSASLLKAEGKQDATLLKGKLAFSAGGQWCTMKFALIGSSAIIRA